MSVLIKGMEMPTSCFLCPLSALRGERLFCEVTKDEVLRAKRPSDCPLVPVQPHGRLVDADAFDERIRIAGGMADEELSDDFKDGVQTALLLLKTQATIIPESV